MHNLIVSQGFGQSLQQNVEFSLSNLLVCALHLPIGMVAPNSVLWFFRSEKLRNFFQSFSDNLVPSLACSQAKYYWKMGSSSSQFSLFKCQLLSRTCLILFTLQYLYVISFSVLSEFTAMISCWMRFTRSCSATLEGKVWLWLILIMIYNYLLSLLCTGTVPFKK